MICSVNFYDMYHDDILMVMKVWSKKKFFIHNFSLPSNTTIFQMIMHWNEFYEKNEIVERE